MIVRVKSRLQNHDVAAASNVAHNLLQRNKQDLTHVNVDVMLFVVQLAAYVMSTAVVTLIIAANAK